jgi:hypothetical protein
MLRCVKCSLTYADSSKICRSCGAILEEIEGEPQSPVALRGDEREQLELIAEQALSAKIQGPDDRLPEKYAWTCSQCAEEVPSSFDICWNCGVDRNGVVAPRNQETDAKREPIDEPFPGPAETAEADAQLRCTTCGSTKVVPNVAVMDQGKYSSGNLQLVVYGSPEALIFKDSRWGEITADICGECGRVQLRVVNAKELYDHYIQSIRDANV